MINSVDILNQFLIEFVSFYGLELLKKLMLLLTMLFRIFYFVMSFCMH